MRENTRYYPKHDNTLVAAYAKRLIDKAGKNFGDRKLDCERKRHDNNAVIPS